MGTGSLLVVPPGRARQVALWLGLAAAALALLADPALARNAYVANQNTDNVSVIDTATNATVGSPIAVTNPNAVAITPNGSRAYVANLGSDNVSVIDTATNATVGSPIAVGDGPTAVAITPDGSRAYVANVFADNVSVIDTTNATVGSPIAVGDGPSEVAITPDGSRAYVANFNADNVSVIDTQANATTGSPIAVGDGPISVAITPDGTRAYVANLSSDNVSVVDTQANSTVGSPIAVGTSPRSVAITPDGSRAYIANFSTDVVSVIDTAMNATAGSPIGVGDAPSAVAITPDGSRAYVANVSSDNVSVIDTATNATAGSPIVVGDGPSSLAITPDQGPRAAFSATRRFNRAAAGQPTAFDGGASNDPDGTVARYDWDFGDGTTLADGGPTPTHTYADPGTYTAALTVTDNEGCSAQFVFTGQTAYCNGSGAARSQTSVSVPDVDAPVLALSGKKRQKLAKAVKLGVSSDEAADATATGKLIVDDSSKGGKRAAKARRFKLKRQTKALAAGTSATFKLRLSKGAQRAGQAALRGGGRVKARLNVKATDAAGNSVTRKRAVKLT